MGTNRRVSELTPEELEVRRAKRRAIQRRRRANPVFHQRELRRRSELDRAARAFPVLVRRRRRELAAFQWGFTREERYRNRRSFADSVELAIETVDEHSLLRQVELQLLVERYERGDLNAQLSRALELAAEAIRVDDAN